MKLYPKQLFGPSGLGTAQARALQARGGAYQWSQRDSGTVVRQQGDFQRVLVTGVEYAASGFVAAGRYRTTAGQRYFYPFVPTPELGAVTYLGQGDFFALGREDVAPVGQVHTYPIYPGATQVLASTVYTNTIGVLARSFYGGARVLGLQTLRYDRANAIPLGTIRQEAPALAYISGGGGDKLAMFAGLTQQGRTDSAGRNLYDVSFFFWRKAGVSDGFPVDAGVFTRPEAEFSEFVPLFEVGGSAVAIAAEKFFFPGPVSGAVNYEPRFWLFFAPAGDFDALGVADVTDDLFPGGFVPAPSTPPGDPVHYGVNAGAVRDGFLNATMGLLRTVTLPGGRALVFYPQFTSDAGSVRWRSRVALLTAEPFSVALVQDQPGSSGSTSISRYVQSAVHLGNGVVLAKVVLGFLGTGHAVQFERSYDGGLSWEVLSPDGFDCPSVNQFFGDLTVHQARTPSAPGVVLTTAWDTGRQAYFVYASKDDGATWSRAGQVAKPDTFRRVDTMLVGDGGGNFQTLYPGPDPARRADVTLPDRYTS